MDLIRAGIDDLPGSLLGKTTGTMNKPKISKLHRRRDGLAVMAVVENALVEEEAEAVLALAHCLKKALPASFERRRFEFTEEGGGNDVTYLAGFLQLMAPGVAHRIQATAKLVWEAAGWKDDDDDAFEPVDVPYRDDDDEELDSDKSPPPPIESAYSTRWWPDPVSECGIRTTEHLSYDRWGGLGYHEDSGSDYTVLLALSDPRDYEGGAFNLCPEYDNDGLAQEEDEGVKGGPNCKDKISVKPNRLSAIVFLSEFSHGVEDIKTPGRVTFANELWRYGDVPCMSQRPTPSQFVLGYDEDDEDDYDYDGDEDEDGNDEGNLLYDGDFGIIEDEELLEQAIE